MNFAPDTAAEEFRAEVRAFLREHLPPETAARTLRGYHSSKADLIGWTRILHARGWSAPHWPREFGGPGWRPLQRHLFEEECALAGAPPTCTSAFMLVAPVIYTFGNAEQIARHLPPILRSSFSTAGTGPMQFREAFERGVGTHAFVVALHAQRLALALRHCLGTTSPAKRPSAPAAVIRATL